MRQIPLPFPYSLYQRGLLALMDLQDKPRGLFSLFGHGDEAEPTEEYGADPEKEARWATDPVFQDARIEELRNAFALPPSEQMDPETRALLRQLRAAGDIATGSAAVATNFGPWARWGLGGPTRIGPRPGAGTTIVPQVSPGPLAGVQQSKSAESQAYGSSRVDDAEAEPLPGSDLLFGGPQAGTIENDETQVYHLPPAADGPDDDADESPEQKAAKERAAEKSKENWDRLCEEWRLRERRRCADQYSYKSEDYFECQRRVQNRYLMCLADKENFERQLTDDQVNGGFKEKKSIETRKAKFRRPRSDR